jgi:DNA-binding NarL/FixJ family response regulator
MSIKIIIADENRIFRNKVRSLIMNHPNMEVVGESKDYETAMCQIQGLAPDVIIMDLNIPYLNCVNVMRRIVTCHPTIRFIALSEITDIQSVFEVLMAGNAGYLLKKNCTFEELVHAVLTVLDNKIYVCAEIAQHILRELVIRSSISKPLPFSMLPELPEGECQLILQFINEGNSMKQIASKLKVNEKNVELYLRKITNIIFSKMTFDPDSLKTEFTIPKNILYDRLLS